MGTTAFPSPVRRRRIGRIFPRRSAFILVALVCVLFIGGGVRAANQVTNGDFEGGFAPDGTGDSIPTAWTKAETRDFEGSTISQEPSNGPTLAGSSSVKWDRPSGQFTGDVTGVSQTLSIDASTFDTLTLAVDTRVDFQELAAGGSASPAFEWPVRVEIRYTLDSNPSVTQIWRHGWYVDPPGDVGPPPPATSPVNDPGSGLIPFYDDTLVSLGVWTANTFDLFAELPDLGVITRIEVSGAGWSFAGAADNVQIVGQNMFWKAGGWTDYAPNGMPDFDQRQNPPAFTCPLNASWSYCGPTAVANSFWWFDSKFEPAPVAPPTLNDNYSLITAFGPTDDHDAANVVPLIDDLSFRMNTDDKNGLFPPRAPFCGTYIDDMAVGVSDFLTSAGLVGDYFVDVVRSPTFDFVASEVERSQDLVLLLGFWQLQEGEWTRIGGHYVTTAGVDRAGGFVAFSDPFLDAAEAASVGGRVLGPPHGHPAGAPDPTHNDAQMVSHDMYTVVATGAPNGVWGPLEYIAALGPGPSGLDNFVGQNSSDELDLEGHNVGPPSGPDPIVATVDYALEVSPCTDDDNDGFRASCDGDCDDTDPNVFPGAAEVCDGVDNNCDGTIDEGFGVGNACAGTGECGAGVVECDGANGTRCSTDPNGSGDQSMPETCDGLDEDCDGTVDNGFLDPPDGVNLMINPGPGAGQLTLAWTGGQPVFEVFRSTTAANVTDPANSLGTLGTRVFVDAPPPGAIFYYRVTSPCSVNCPEQCDGTDNDCDGTIDGPGSEVNCSLAHATPVCLGGGCAIGFCDTGFDDCNMIDSDGCEIDLGTNPTDCGICGNVCTYANAGAACVSGSCQMGPCVSGFDDCNSSDADGCEVDINNNPLNCGLCGNVCGAPANSNALCLGGSCGFSCVPGFEDCNLVAGDGCEVDLLNDLGNCGSCGNVCVLPNAVETCSGGNCAVASCDPVFGNCNGNHADGCEVDLLTDNNHCGSCGSVCNPQNASGSCTGGNCSIGACDANFWDINGDPGDGCEYFCVFSSSVDEPDLGGVDKNCDGIDGDVSRAVFVSPAGSNGNPGTQSQPVQTIQHAIGIANAATRDQVIADQGTYVETITLKNGVGVHGGYRRTLDWARTLSYNLSTIDTRPINQRTAVVGSSLSSTTVLEYLTIFSDDASSPGSSLGVSATNSDGLIVRGCRVEAGKGHDGSQGSNSGGSGVPGANSALGQRGCEDSTFTCDSCPRPQGGNGGVNGACSGANGGRGGNAGHGSSNGSPGQSGSGGAPGGPGTPDGNGNWNTPPTYWGQDGAPGTQGPSGSPGLPSYSASGYNPTVGGLGIKGGVGRGGGGGGGGGGGTSACDSYGGGGSGGGAGGCGGVGGGGATSGGGSFAIWLWNSDARIEDCLLVTSGGGDGGDGGTGQLGGQGGLGAQVSGAGNPYGGSGDQDDGSNGGIGGDGGDGGRGGQGGGAAGGPSVGILRGGGSNPVQIGNAFSLAPQGQGGAPNGPDGVRTSVYTP